MRSRLISGFLASFMAWLGLVVCAFSAMSRDWTVFVVPKPCGGCVHHLSKSQCLACCKAAKLVYVVCFHLYSCLGWRACWCCFLFIDRIHITRGWSHWWLIALLSLTLDVNCLSGVIFFPLSSFFFPNLTVGQLVQRRVWNLGKCFQIFNWVAGVVSF